MSKLIVIGDSFCDNYAERMNQNIDVVSSNEPKVLTKWKPIKRFPIWPEIVADRLKMTLVNHSFSGIGNWAIYSIALDAIMSNKGYSKFIVVWSGSNRINFEDPEETITWMKRYDGHYRDGVFTKEITTSPRGNIKSYLRYVYSLQEICKVKNVDITMFQSVHPFNRKDFHNKDYYSKDTYVKMGIDMLDSPYYNKIDKSIFPDFPGDEAFGGTSLSMTDLMKMKDNLTISKLDHHPNEFGSKVIADHVIKHL